jgi:cell division transport system permease protein
MTTRKSLYLPATVNYILQHLRAFRLSINQLSFEPIATFMTFMVIGMVLALPMGLFVLLQNIHTVTSGLHDTAQISLYLQKDISPTQVNNLLRVLRNNQEIASAKYISPDVGLLEFQQQSHFADVLTELHKNPLPGVIVIQPVKSMQAAWQIEELLVQLRKLPQVQEAQLDLAWLKRLNAIVALGHRLVYAVMLLFAFGVFLIIGNTIRLTTQRYRDEIAILKLLGGTERFIRRPFLYGGVLYGLLGGIIAWFLVDGIMWWLRGAAERLASLYGSQFQVQGLTTHSAVVLLVGGIILGYAGSWIAVGRHIKAIEP